VTVQSSLVLSISNTPPKIPADGYVLAFYGNLASMASRFSVNDQVQYRPEFKGSVIQQPDQVGEMLGCGPRLVSSGQICLQPGAEGFKDPKVLSASGQRSAIGLLDENRLVLVSTSGTMAKLAQAMKVVGCVEALNLDGGASSCLYLKGKWLTGGGRDLSNMLLFRLKPAK